MNPWKTSTEDFVRLEVERVERDLESSIAFGDPGVYEELLAKKRLLTKQLKSFEPRGEK